MSKIKCLIITHRPMLPDMDGGAKGMYEFAKAIHNSGINVAWATMRKKGDTDLTECPQASIFSSKYFGPSVSNNTAGLLLLSIINSVQPFNMWKYESEDFKAQLIDIVAGERPDFIICEHLHTAQYGGVLKKLYPDTPIILREHNVEYVILRRMASGFRNPIKRLIYAHQARRLRKYEKKALGWVDQVIAVTATDANMLNSMRPDLAHPVEVVLSTITGPDRVNKTFMEGGAIRLLHFAAMESPANQEGLLWFLDAVLPILRSLNIRFRLSIFGKGMPDWVAHYAAEDVMVRGFVENVEDAYAEADLALVTVQAGSGVRIKILEHSIWGVPIVSTRVGAEGLVHPLESGVSVCDSAKEYANIISRFANDPARLYEMSNRGWTWVMNHYSEKSTARSILSLVNRVKGTSARL
ncbi:glycosyltransferase family 4 protein [Acidithiobacillus ferrivorans]|uniref:glycosyltransferase family 4 protein n=1 Tax=Acidithiobacillus ferrivorans TaxID=160808 RepID=UPI001C07022C|nr:glycosyltransferase family 4 protein [Acidithiobacillus ferrivorans]MBU2851342.1 glycosyltransferase family 4 protein [Acidithiobacillus ferrivorans]